MSPAEELFVYVYVLIHDLMPGGAIVVPDRPGPAPACTDAELLAIAIVRHLLGPRSEARFLQQAGTCALPVKHPSRVRGADQWTGPGNDLAARFGRDAAHAEWFYGFRLAIRTDLGRRLVRAWSIVPAAIDERQIGTDLITGDAAAIDALLLDKGFTGSRFAAEMASAGIEVIIPPTRAQRATMPKTLQRLIARLRNRVETSFKEITDQMELARHGAHTFWGLLTRTAATIAAHTLLMCLAEA